MKIREIFEEIFFTYSPSLISLGYLFIVSSKYYFYFWIVYIGVIVSLMKIYKKYKKHGSSSDDYYFKLEKALLDFITYANIGKPIEFSMKNFLLKKDNNLKEINDVYKLLRNGVYIQKALEKYESNILKIISRISLYSKKEFLTQVSKAINFVRREREISRKVFDKMRIIQFRLKLIGIIISLSLSVSCHILCYISPYEKIDENTLIIFFSLILSISYFHILKVFEEEYYNIFSETVFLEILYFSALIFLKYFLF